MLNLPRVTGWGSDTIARAIMERSEEKRKKEDEKTKMIGNAILKEAQQGNFTEEGFRVIEQHFGPEVASVFKKTAERAKNENELRLENMKREKTLGPLKMVNEYIKGLDTLDKMGNIDKESAAAITKKINDTYRALGLDITINPLMDSRLRKQEHEKSVIKTINAEIKKVETSPTPDNLSKAYDTITLFSDSIDKTLLPIYKARLDAITNKLQKQQEQTDKMATEKRAEKTKIEGERRTQKIKMTNPKNGRTVEVPASQQRAFEQAGWELGGPAEKNRETGQTLSPFGKLFNERGSYPAGSNEYKQYTDKIIKESTEGDVKPVGIVAQFEYVYGRKPAQGAAGAQELREFKQDITAPTEKERDLKMRKEALSMINKATPEEAYSRGWKMNDDGTVFTELDSNAPVKLPSFEKLMGKRGMTMAVLTAGEQYDDAVQIWNLLQDTEVKGALGAAKNAGMWDIAIGSWSNKINGWLQKNGYAYDSKTTQAIIRMGRLASRERKEFLGTAVSAGELQSVRSWMPDIGDSYELMIAKIRVVKDEGKEVFKRFLDTYKNEANMAPFYSAFGIKRFDNTGDSTEVKAIKNKYGLK